MQIHHERLSHSIQFDTETRTFAIPRISAHPSMPQPILPAMRNDFECKLILGAKNLLAFRNTGFLTSGRIVSPFFRKIQV